MKIATTSTATTDLQDRAEAELETTLKLANARLLIGGYAAQGSYDAWQRARSLATELNDTEGYLRAALGIGLELNKLDPCTPRVSKLAQ